MFAGTESVVVYFWTATNRRSRGVLWSIIAPSFILIEFKRPSYSVGRMDVSQAEQYRDDLTKHFSPIDVRVIVGAYDSRMLQNLAPGTTVTSYGNVINRARLELAWLLQELSGQASATVSQ